MEGIKTMKSVVHPIPMTRARISLGQVGRRAHLNREYFIRLNPKGAGRGGSFCLRFVLAEL